MTQKIRIKKVINKSSPAGYNGGTKGGSEIAAGEMVLWFSYQS